MTIKVAYSRQPLVRQITADFTTEYGTRYQICAFLDTGSINYGVKGDSPDATWSYGVFRYAEGWRERNNWPAAWNEATFTQMITDFLKEGES